MDGKDAYFSFGKVAAGSRDPMPEEMAYCMVGPVRRPGGDAVEGDDGAALTGRVSP